MTQIPSADTTTHSAEAHQHGYIANKSKDDYIKREHRASWATCPVQPGAPAIRP